MPVDPIGKPDKKRKPSKPLTRQGQVNRRRAQARKEARERWGRRAALGGAGVSGVAPKRPKRMAPQEPEAAPAEEREERRKEQPKREEREQQPEAEKKPEEKKEEAEKKPGEEVKPEGKEEKPEGQAEGELEPGEAPAREAPEAGEAGAEAGVPAEAGEAGAVEAGEAGAVEGGAVEGGAVAGGATAGGAAAGGATAVEGEAVAAGTVEIWGPILAAILIFIAIILLILAIVFIISQLGGAGRSPKQEPNPNSQADMIERGKAIANASGGANSLVQARGMAGNESFNQSKDEISQIAALAPAGIDKNKLNDLSQNLNLNLDVLQSGAGDDVYVANESDKIKDFTNQIKTLTANCTDEDCQKLNSDADKISAIMDELKNYSFTKEDSSIDNKEMTTKAPSGIEINPLDLQYIKDNKIDIRLLRLLNNLAAAEWDQLKISRIADFEERDDESRITTNNEGNTSAHNSGQAIDIEIVGTYTCTKKEWKKDMSGNQLGGLIQKDVYHLPCYVYFQSRRKSDIQTAFGNPRGDSFNSIFNNFSFDEAAKLLGLRNFDGNNFAEFLTQAGIYALVGEMGLTPDGSGLPTTDSGWGSFALGQSLGIDPSVFLNMIKAGNSDAAWTDLGAGILSQEMDLPIGSFEGSSQDEILKNIGLNYARESLGLSRTSPTGDLIPQSIGSSLLEKYLLTRDPGQTKDRLRLSDNIIRQNLNLPPEITSDFVSDKIDYNKFSELVGNNEIERLQNTYRGAGLERALGLPAGSWQGVITNNQDTLKKVGAAILARNTLLDETKAYNDPNQMVNDLSRQAVVNITVTDQNKLAEIVKGGDKSKENLNSIADNFMQNKSVQDLDYSVRDSLNKLNISLSKITGSQFKNIFSPEILSDMLQVASNTLLENSIYSYQASFGNYQMSTSDIERVRRGGLSSVAYKIGAGLLDQDLQLPNNFSSMLIDNNGGSTGLLANAGISLLGKIMGVDISGTAMTNSWSGSGSILKNFAQIRIEGRGLKDNTFTGSIDNIIAANGLPAVLATFGLTDVEYQALKSNQLDDYAKSKLYLFDAGVGIPNGSSYNLLSGTADANSIINSLMQALNQTLANGGLEGIISKLGLDTDHLPVGDLLAAVSGDNPGATNDFFSSLADNFINQNLNTDSGFFSSIIMSDNPGQEGMVTQEGINLFSKLISPNQSSQIASLFSNSYLQGGSISSSDLLQNSTGITNSSDALGLLSGDAKNGLSSWGIGEITQEIGRTFPGLDVGYDDGREMLRGDEFKARSFFEEALSKGKSIDEANQIYREVINQTRGEAGKTVGSSYLDMGMNRVNSSFGAGSTQTLLEGSDQDRQNFAYSFFENQISANGSTLKSGTLSNLNNFMQNNDFNDLSTETLAKIDSSLNLSSGTSGIVNNYVQNNGEFGFDLSTLGNWAEPSLSDYMGDNMGFDLNSIINLDQTVSSGDFSGIDPANMAVNFLIDAFASQFASQIDQQLGLPGFTSALIEGLVFQDWIPMAFVVINKIFGISVHCQDPITITRAHIRSLLGQALRSPDTPNQIATFRKQDINYYSGLKNNGEIDMRLENILYEKYGPTGMRVYRGMFDLPSTFDHVHIGY